jgi:Sugar (and other) transporter
MTVQIAIRDGMTERNGGMATVVFAGSVGTIIEWYDFLIYGTAAALVFNTLFFPNIDPLAGILASLATYSVGFVARPIGGAIFGHFGDRIGRKIMLMITLVIMALGTFAVGCLPTYQQIGVWAPILLVILRFIQGIGLGGEWGGASDFGLISATNERPRGRGRGAFVSKVSSCLFDHPDDTATAGLNDISLVVHVRVPILNMTGHLVHFDLRGQRFADHDRPFVYD